ncbi:MAG: hypothetical protein IJ328_01835 [Muribaculaceae bacterium]|nr:hypothetical protein [Muribaculaceae bacterium]
MKDIVFNFVIQLKTVIAMEVLRNIINDIFCAEITQSGALFIKLGHLNDTLSIMFTNEINN